MRTRHPTILVLAAVLTFAASCGDDDGPTTPPTPQPLRVTSVIPATGSTSAITSIQILGTGFTASSTLTLGGAATPVTFLNAGLLRANAPPRAAGPVDIVVANPGGETSRLADGFTYVSPITALHAASGTAAETSSDGFYTMGALIGARRLRATTGDYEDVEVDNFLEGFADLPMQRVVHIGAGGPTVNQRLAPNDVQYPVAPGVWCQPCRLIRISSEAAATVQVCVTWTGPAALHLWTATQRLSATSEREIVATVSVGVGDTMIYVGKVDTTFEFDDYVNFAIAVLGTAAARQP